MCSHEHSNGSILVTVKWWRWIVAALLIAASSLQDIPLLGVTISGNAALAALGILYVIWPLFLELMNSGGKAEILGLSIQLDRALEKAEIDYGVEIARLRSELEELRQLATGTEPPPAETSHDDPLSLIRGAINDYYTYRNTGWKDRVAVDRRLASLSSRPKAALLQPLLEDGSQESRMAVAVVLGRYRSDDVADTADLLIQLLGKNSRSRAIHRAARSATLLLNRRVLTEFQRNNLVSALIRAHRSTQGAATKASLEEALVAGNRVY